MSSELVALNSNWLDTTTANPVAPIYGGGVRYDWSGPSFNGYTFTYVYPYTGPAKPIRLTMAEVDRLRSAAKRDAKLKAVLAKFTDQIEVIVDLG